MAGIRILITDDHPLVRQGLRTYMELQDDLQVVAEAANGRDALDLIRQLKPDVALMDLVMPEVDGLGVLQTLKDSGASTRVIVLTSFLDEQKALACIEAGAMGYLTKDIQPADLVDSIRAVYKGEPRLHPQITRKLMQQALHPTSAKPTGKELLTSRELDVLRCLTDGMTNREIAEKLFISETTVKTHISSILAKLQLSDRTQAALYAVKEKLLD